MASIQPVFSVLAYKYYADKSEIMNVSRVPNCVAHNGAVRCIMVLSSA